MRDEAAWCCRSFTSVKNGEGKRKAGSLLLKHEVCVLMKFSYMHVRTVYTNEYTFFLSKYMLNLAQPNQRQTS